MRLKRLEIYGFKSFADRTVVDFDSGITGIVGPNGSGKSNLSDAMRWVLGEQSAKALRGGKMEDVIFNGTEKRKRLGYCEVSLVFENEDRALDIDFAEVMITRRVYRSGEGEYYINRASCRLKDIIDLFRDTGVGKEGYSIIGQGRIDEILSQKSEDRRGVFEEAAGIVKYRTRKQESEKRLANMRDNLSRVEDIISELESQLEPLAKASETARRYLALRDEMRTLECSAFVLRTDHAGQRIAEAEALLEGLRDAIAAEEKTIEELTQARDGANESVLTLDAEVNAANETVLSLTRETEAREGELAILRAEIERMEKDVLTMTQDEDVASAKAEQLTLRIAQGEKDLLTARSDMIALDRDLGEQEQALSAAQDAVQAAEDVLEAHKNAIINSINRLSDVRANEARLSAQNEEQQSRRTEALERRENLRHKAEQYDADVDNAGEALTEASRQLKTRETEERQIEEKTKEVDGKLLTLRNLSEDVVNRRSTAESRLNMLREMERDYAGYQQSVRDVLRYAKGNSKVRGVVLSLMDVPKEYEKAVEYALGGALQNIVTEDEYVARDMIGYLKKNRLGRATFLPMTSVMSRTLNPQERSVLSLPGCLGVASELIGFAPEYRGIMENLLGRTVIAEHLDAGIEIQRRGRHSFRVVTLDGDVMNNGGSMSGGSSSSRMTSLLSREREIKEHEAQISELNGQEKELKQRIEKGTALRAALKEQHAAAYDALHQAQIDESIAREHVRIAEERRAEHDKLIEACEQMILQIESNLKEIGAQLSGTRSTQQDEQQSSEDMNRRTGELSDDLYEKREALDALRNTVQTIRIRRAARERDINALTQDQTRMERELRELGMEIGQLRENREALILRHQQSIQQEAQDKGERDDCRKQLETAKTTLSERQKQRLEVQERVRRLTAEVDEQRQIYASDSERCHKTEMVLDRTKNDMQQLQQRIWDDYELTYAGAKEYLREPFDLNASDRRTGEIRREIRAMGPVNVTAVEDYRACRERYEDLTGQRDDLLRAQDDLQRVIDKLQKQMEAQFLEEFTKLQGYFNETFRRLFGGGRAELQLMDANDVLGCGIEIVAQPPGKKLQLLSLLSGGERALTAIAILFAMLQLKPTPFCFLDEIEAALDDGNISTFADYLRGFSGKTQFVVVTHRKGTMERCDGLYGVAMEEKGVSKMLSVELKDVNAEAMA